MMPTIYLSGPMSGHADYNFPRFDEVAAEIRKRGFRVINPADLGNHPDLTWKECLIRDIAALGYSDALVSMEGSNSSKGARLESHIAWELGLPVIPLQIFLANDTAHNLEGIADGRWTRDSK